LPGASGDKRGSRVEEVLSVLQIEHGILAVGLFFVAGRQVDGYVAVVGQEAAVELGVNANPRVKGLVWSCRVRKRRVKLCLSRYPCLQPAFAFPSGGFGSSLHTFYFRARAACYSIRIMKEL
jgi:hypothetical protein